MSASVQVASAAAAHGEQRSLPPRRRRAGLWPWVPGLLLGSLLGAQLLVLGSALDDPTFATERDYYRKAVDWDARMARQRQSQALGWSPASSIEREASGVSRLRLRLTDAHGAAIEGAVLRASAFHIAHSAHPLELGLSEVEPGVYAAELGRARPGLWEVRLSASRGGAEYESTQRVEITEPRR